jgi:hypothetical protein
MERTDSDPGSVSWWIDRLLGGISFTEEWVHCSEPFCVQTDRPSAYRSVDSHLV